MSQEAKRQLMWPESAGKLYALKLEDQVDLRANVMLPDGDSTICFWLKCYSVGTYGFGVYGWADGGWGGSRFTASASTVDVRYATGDSSTSYSLANTSIIDQKWRHWCIRRAGSAFTVAMNGEMIFEASAARPHAADNLPLSLGSIGNDNDYSETVSHRGAKSICMLGIWQRALSDVELEKQMKLTSFVAVDDCIAAWKLDSQMMLVPTCGIESFVLHNRYNKPVEFNDLLDLSGRERGEAN